MVLWKFSKRLLENAKSTFRITMSHWCYLNWHTTRKRKKLETVDETTRLQGSRDVVPAGSHAPTHLGSHKWLSCSACINFTTPPPKSSGIHSRLSLLKWIISFAVSVLNWKICCEQIYGIVELCPHAVNRLAILLLLCSNDGRRIIVNLIDPEFVRLKVSCYNWRCSYNWKKQFDRFYVVILKED